MPGCVLDGRYQLEEELGRGGTAAIWRARDLRLNQPVAVKVLTGDSRADPRMTARLRREADTLARLSHPNIVGVRGFGVDGDCSYLVMDLVDGRDLATQLTDGPLPVDRAVTIATQICDALAAAHAVGVVHRDIKPANVMLAA